MNSNNFSDMGIVDLNLIGGKVFVEGGLIEACVSVNAGKIVKVGKKAALPRADEVFDASGKIIIPGVIDVHVHVRDLKQKSVEDWQSASKAAAAGGVTTILAMPNTDPPLTSKNSVDSYLRIASKKSIVNYGAYIGATCKNGGEIVNATTACAVKVYMGSSTGDLLVNSEDDISSSFKSAGDAGKIACVHAEDEARINGKTGVVKKKKIEPNPSVHSFIRDPEACRKAVEKAIRQTESAGNILHICHSSTRAEMQLIIDARKRGTPVSCEVTPHHLFLSTKDYENTNIMKVNPPLRDRSDLSSMWGALQEGYVDIIASDHAPHLMDDKLKDYWDAPAGFPGVETMLPLILDAVGKNMLSLDKAVQLTSVNPARLFGLVGKGRVKEGFDADFSVIDMKKSVRIRGDDLHSKCGWTPFEGRVVTGVPCATIVGGHFALRDDSIIDCRGKPVQLR